MQIDLAAVGTAIAAVITGAAGWWAGRGKRKVEDERAQAESDLYETLRAELAAMRKDVETLRADLDAARAHNKLLDNYVWYLVRLLREKGVEPTPITQCPPSTN